MTVFAYTKISRAILSNSIVRHLKHRREAKQTSEVKRSEVSCDIIEQYRAISEAKSREAKQTREAKLTSEANYRAIPEVK